jgi:hypothetical protein
MVYTTWLFIAYGAALFYLSVNRQKAEAPEHLRTAWFIYLLAVASHVVFTVFRAASHDLALVEIWASGATWLLVAVSMFYFLDSMFPREAASVPAPEPAPEAEEGDED